MLTYTGKLHLYYNHAGAAPRVWCIRAGAWELAVISVNAVGVDMESKYHPRPDHGDRDDDTPSAWFECCGTLTVSAEGHAVINPGTTEEPTRRSGARL